MTNNQPQVEDAPSSNKLIGGLICQNKIAVQETCKSSVTIPEVAF